MVSRPRIVTLFIDCVICTNFGIAAACCSQQSDMDGEKKSKKKLKGKTENSKEVQISGNQQAVDDLHMDPQKKSHKMKENKNTNKNSEEAEMGDVGMDAEKKWKKEKKKKKYSEAAQAHEMIHDAVDNGDMESEKKSKEKKKNRNKNLEQREEKPGIRESVAQGDGLEKRKQKEMLCDYDGNEAVRESPVEGPSHKKQRRVSFSDQVQVFVGQDTTEQAETANRSGASSAPPIPTDGEGKLVWTKRFTPEEDAAIKDAILKYIKEHGMDEDAGLHMILNCKKYSEVRNCWDEIAACLHWRPRHSVYRRAHVLYERAPLPGWTKDELILLKSLHAVHGNKWKKIADVLQKSRFHVKDTWRRLKRGPMNEGEWSQDEYQKLFDLVNLNLQLKSAVGEDNHSGQQFLRNNLCWESIADEMATRDHASCCKKWYRNLSSSMVENGQWENADDQRLLKRLLESNAFDEEGIDWNDLLEDRSGETCLKRWRQMVKYLGEYRNRSFLEQLDLLVKRYASHLVE